jgi:membrane-associated phospholipid phosphatase
MKTARHENLPVNHLSGQQKKILSMGLISLLLFIFISLIHFVFPSIDHQLDLWLVILFAGRGYRFFGRITELGNIWLVLPAALVLFLILFLKFQKDKSFHLLVTVFGGAIFGFLLKILFSPDLNAANLNVQTRMDLGFPSGHALMGTLFYGWLVFMAFREIQNRYLKWSAVFLGMAVIFLIGVSRLVISVHFATDVLAGWAAGVLWLSISNTIMVWPGKFIQRLSPAETYRCSIGE